MAEITTRVDDLNGDSNAKTVTFTVDGKTHEIDLGPANIARYIRPLLTKSTTASGARPSLPGQHPRRVKDVRHTEYPERNSLIVLSVDSDRKHGMTKIAAMKKVKRENPSVLIGISQIEKIVDEVTVESARAYRDGNPPR